MLLFDDAFELLDCGAAVYVQVLKVLFVNEYELQLQILGHGVACWERAAVPLTGLCSARGPRRCSAAGGSLGHAEHPLPPGAAEKGRLPAYAREGLEKLMRPSPAAPQKA
mmetsp:Transcript_126085/g.315075  ORF Transcript_126085/g.315075 Transcript_126085/m.315075 type:complete len:110 (-) Transcript_126085:7-336(-)